MCPRQRLLYSGERVLLERMLHVLNLLSEEKWLIRRETWLTPVLKGWGKVTEHAPSGWG